MHSDAEKQRINEELENSKYTVKMTHDSILDFIS